ncbi:adenosylcobinamide-GDP ribazoletransferase [Halobellus captivus]|uniref:adenosylcobinamide-GDP ribazoletransferase n=1 Tax=Halobellus captivus TaxID=2592614 RepID=UPI001EF02F4B|nr:adenosylcobinamide-GDP ribazoletransferase [Halobellus captivus]
MVLSVRTALSALRGALGFLTRLPLGGDEDSWNAFRITPVSIPLVGYVVGALAALPLFLALALPLPGPSAAALYLVALVLLTGVTHADGLADLGDAAAVHGGVDEARRREVLKDSQVGVGGALAVSLAFVTLALGVLSLAGTDPRVAFALALAAEVGAKAGMALLVCTRAAAHDGLGSALTESATPTELLSVTVAVLPVVGVAWLAGAGYAVVIGALGALVAPVVTAWLLGRWAGNALGGVTGDVLGAANELGRVAGVHAGVIAWTLW